MRTRIALAAAAALATTLATAPGALAAGAVYGGTTSRGEAIVIKADKSGKKLRSAVIAWNADCGDQSYLARGSSVTATKASPGFAPDSAVLETSRNGKGRFAGKQTMALGNDTSTAAVAVTLDGRLGKKAASGTLSAVATITDVASGSTVGTCATGRLTWRATHAPGRVYAGRTTQDEPVVVRLDVKRKRVTDLFVSWDSQSCQPDGLVHFGEGLSDFPLASSGRFGDTWQDTQKLSDGGTAIISYSVGGKLARRTMRGSLRIGFTLTDTAGATTRACDSGRVTWKATTG